MKTMNFSITIKATKEKVWDTMLQQETYRIWAAEFMEGSYYEGSWEQGAKIRFLGPGGSGITSAIAVNIPYRLISIQHLGLINNGIDDTESPEAKVWSFVYENYTFDQQGDHAELKVDISAIPAEFEQMMADTWPQALARLKLLCE